MAQNYWWNAKEGEANQGLSQIVRHLRENQNYRHEDNLRHVRLYGNMDVVGLSTGNYSRPNAAGINHRVTLNVIKSCVDTAQAKIAKNKPRPTFLTEGGNPKKQRQAKNLQKFIDGLFYKAKVRETTPKCFVDGGVFGTALVKVFSQKKEIFVERSNPDEILVDDAEGFYGSPKNLYQTKAISRNALKQRFPKYKDLIENLPRADQEKSFFRNDHADLVEVYEGWRLPNDFESKDGKHVLAVNGADLVYEPWTRPNFPFAKFTWSDRIFGWFGAGIAEELIGLQVEINKLLRAIQLAHHLLSAPAVYVEKGSEVISSHINNEIGRIIKYKGTIPVVKADGTVNPEIYQHLERLYQRAYEIVGISQLSAQSKKPGGLDSGKALREFNDIETERFMIVGQKWEQFHLDIANLCIQEAEYIYKTEGNFEILAKNKGSLEKLSWKDVRMESSEYIMQCFPTSGLSQTPQGRLADVQEMMQAGLIDPEIGMDLMNFPDLEAHYATKLAPKRLVRDTVEKILEEGEFISPEPMMDLDYCVQYGTAAYCRGKLDRIEPERMELLTRFIETANAMLGKNQPETQAPALPQPDIGQPVDPSMSELPPVA
jgi:hypothetical protein